MCLCAHIHGQVSMCGSSSETPVSIVSQGTVENGSCAKTLICVRNTIKQFKKQQVNHLCPQKYEAYVKSKFRYKIYLAMNDVTSILYVSLVRQFKTLLFYVVTSRIEALVVSRHKFLNACVEKDYRMLQPIVYCHFHLYI